MLFAFFKKLSLPLIFLLTACTDRQESANLKAADKVFVNGAVYRVDDVRSWAEAVAIIDGRIAFVGNNDEALAWQGQGTEVIDLHGQMLLPGFHDSHTHILIGVETDEECDLLRLNSIAEVENRLRDCTTLAGFGADHWIIGGGWSDWLWPRSEPDKAILDQLFPDRPVYLESSFGHSAWVNSRALELANIHPETRAGADGIIVRDPETGEATGSLHDSAMLLVKEVLPSMSIQHQLKSIRAGIRMAHSVGVTSIIEPGIDEVLIAPILSLYDNGEFDLRAVISLSPINWQPGTFNDGVFEFLQQRESWARPNIDVNSVKIYMDGVIESGTGALLEPYEIASLGLGPRFYPQEKVDAYFQRFDAMGLQIHVHAVGDAGVRMALNGFEAMQAANGVSGNRHHITHLQLIHEDDRPRFAKLDIGATFQTLWAYPDPSSFELDVPMIGEQRTFQMYPIGSVHRAGGRIVGGSDYFVTDMNPLLAIEVGLTRQDPYSNSGPVMDAGERVDLATMIDAYTINGAYTMKLEGEQGSIEVGKRADFVVLDQNLFEIDAQKISDVKVIMTVFDGRIVYRRGNGVRTKEAVFK